MKVLLTGFTGFLGQYLGRLILQNGEDLRIILHRHTLPKTKLKKGVEVIWGKMDNEPTIEEAIEGVDCVIHSGWSFNSSAKERPTVNEKSAELLLKTSIESNVKKFIFISSVAVYGMKNKKAALINEESAFAKGKDLNFVYPSEKVSIENLIQNTDRKNMLVAIFRPGPIFDDEKAPAKKIVNIGRIRLGIGIGDGKNTLPYIHAQDVADAVIRWLKNGKSDSAFNVVPSKSISYRKWITLWGKNKGQNIRPVFIPISISYLLGFGINILKTVLNKSVNDDFKYGIKCAKRDIEYNNEKLISTLSWKDKYTANITDFN